MNTFKKLIIHHFQVKEIGQPKNLFKKLIMQIQVRHLYQHGKNVAVLARTE